DFSLVLAPSSAEPGIWGRLATGRPVARAVVHVRDGSGNVLVTYTLSNVLISSFATNEAGGLPSDQLTLSFQSIAEDYRPAGGGAANHASFDQGRRIGQAGGLSAPALAAPPT